MSIHLLRLSEFIMIQGQEEKRSGGLGHGQNAAQTTDVLNIQQRLPYYHGTRNNL